VTLVFTQGVVAAIMNTLSAGVFGSLLLIAYARTRTQASSLE
jgi:energy-coupling factor transport system substrate-specific component